jgi:hypothetical protein
MPQPDIATIAEIVRVQAAKRSDAVALVVGEVREPYWEGVGRQIG